MAHCSSNSTVNVCNRIHPTDCFASDRIGSFFWVGEMWQSRAIDLRLGAWCIQSAMALRFLGKFTVIYLKCKKRKSKKTCCVTDFREAISLVEPTLSALIFELKGTVDKTKLYTKSKSAWVFARKLQIRFPIPEITMEYIWKYRKKNLDKKRLLKNFATHWGNVEFLNKWK